MICSNKISSKYVPHFYWSKVGKSTFLQVIVYWPNTKAKTKGLLVIIIHNQRCLTVTGHCGKWLTSMHCCRFRLLEQISLAYCWGTITTEAEQILMLLTGGVLFFTVTTKRGSFVPKTPCPVSVLNFKLHTPTPKKPQLSEKSNVKTVPPVCEPHWV